MKSLFALLLVAALLAAGCVSNNGAQAPVPGAHAPPKPGGSEGMPNPASKFCADLGYTFELRGSEGICKFPNGRECEEWAFFQGQCTDMDSFEMAEHEETFRINPKSLSYKFYADGRLILAESFADGGNGSRMIAWLKPGDFALFAKSVGDAGFEKMKSPYAVCESGPGCPYDAASAVFTLVKQGRQIDVFGYAYAAKPEPLAKLEKGLKAIVENSTFVDVTSSGCTLMKEGRANRYRCFGCPKGITNPKCSQPGAPVFYEVNDSAIGSCTIGADGACEYLPPGYLHRRLCETWGGRWNGCGSACRGAPEGTACTLQCVEYCECGSKEGYRCPDRYFCTGLIDGVGICKPLA